MHHIAVVGASLAGTSAVEALRDQGFDGTVTLIDAAPELPADRPPLSKQVLAGTMAPEAAALPAAARLDELAVDLRLGRRAVGLRPADRCIALDDGAELVVDGVVLATGASPRRLATDLAGVHVVRDLADSLALRADLLATPARVVVVGAGFIGAEVAATCRSLGLDVTMVEAQPYPLQRVLPGEIGSTIAALHADHGVDVRLGVGIDAIEGGSRVERVRLADGSVIDADVVVAGIGVTPSVGWLEGSGLDLSDGIVCDATCLAAPGIVACGDVARWPNPRFDESMRVEQWENAIEQGRYVAGRLLAGGSEVEPFAPVPWFWSDQYDRKIQLAGRVAPTDVAEVVEGSLDEERFVVLFRRGDRCSAVLGVNRPRHVVQLRMALGEASTWADGLSWDDARVRFA